jgi:hypothetical protein
MYRKTRKWMGIGWLGLCLILIVVSGEARAFVIFGLLIATFFFLGLERLVKMVLGKN